MPEPIAALALRVERAPKMHPKGRVCELPGCSTVLSRYNSAESCFLHTERKPARPIRILSWKPPAERGA